MRLKVISLVAGSITCLSLHALGNKDALPEYTKEDPLVHHGREGNSGSSLELSTDFKTGYIYSDLQSHLNIKGKTTKVTDKNHFWAFGLGGKAEVGRGMLRGLSVTGGGQFAWSLQNTRSFEAHKVHFKDDRRSGNGSKVYGARADLGWNLSKLMDGQSNSVVRPHIGYSYDCLKSNARDVIRNGHTLQHQSTTHWYGPYVGINLEGHFESSHAFRLLGRFYFATAARLKSTFDSHKHKFGTGWEIQGDYRYYLSNSWAVSASLGYKQMRAKGDKKATWKSIEPMVGLHLML